MSTRHAHITWVFMHIIYNYRCSIKKDRLKHTNPLNWSKVAKMFLDCRRCTRNRSEIKYFLGGSLMRILACNFWNEEKSSILRSSNLAGSISNHLQQALQVKFRGQRNSYAVQFRQFFCPLLQIRYELCATFIDSLGHLTLPQLKIPQLKIVQ